MTDLVHRTAARLRDERGMALVMALGVSFVLSILGASVILYTTSNERSSNRQNASTSAYSIAQAGIDNAASQLAELTKPPNGALLVANPGETAPDNVIRANCAAAAGNCTQAVDGGSVTWDAWLEEECETAPCNPAEDVMRYVWHLSATGTIANPTAPGTLTRTVTADIELKPADSQTVNADAWKYVYSKKTGTPTKPGEPFGCDEVIYNNTTLRSPMYVSGNLCLQNSSELIGPTPPATTPPVELIVKGMTWLCCNDSYIGYDKGPPNVDQPVNRVYFDQGCKFKAGLLLPVCGVTEQVFIMHPLLPAPAKGTSLVGGPTIPAPVAAFQDWYKFASPGPRSPCDPTLDGTYGSYPNFDDRLPSAGDGVRNRSKGTLNLTPATAYGCETKTGELRWTPGSPGELFIRGTIFWDGGVEVNGVGRVDYTGVGAIYMSGTFYMRQSTLCGNYDASGNCAFTGWNFTDNMLVLVAEWTGAPASNGMSISLDQSTFQGALYAEVSIEVGASSNAQGPMVAQQEVIKNNSDTQDFPDDLTVPFGTPGNVITTWGLTPPTNYTG